MSFFREAIQSQCLLPTLNVNLIATYISGVRVILIGAYSIDDLYHIGLIDTLGIRLIITVYFLVVIVWYCLTLFHVV